ncbi:hypothetical protein GT347_13380 [Xylophilus rhododendri]|uniref:Uncharacterized protein n=1 Tax=Xylophilus rhododendri TaxID=2697032 RepID=A0A857J6M2_9BURK|nr:hypothetical protein [Xylophilus rhododendri]QHI98893.1 hypothetical protein GT347_13380 [Xylophilus rhododendri]
MQLQYLDFDISEDADGSVVFDAMATVAAERLPALHGEIAALLGWAHAQFPDARAPLDEGGEWDYLLEGAQEVRIPLALHYDPQAAHISSTAGAPGPARHTVQLSLAGTAAFAEALREAFELG